MYKLTVVRNTNGALTTTETVLDTDDFIDTHHKLVDAYRNDETVLLAWMDGPAGSTHFVGCGPRWSAVSKNVRD